ncbi:hypothetical protein PV371_15930 [Streptomyces sp. TX20-6-3]|uniref:hypothetical protein n=1 Tax=Streptomyces sp. TX20-6-3 TaxID=3028705 RepID=UPI0029A5E1B1|nr:hypothetical protein [Streptomyces sp. TX20-6-3]MDX2561139.1 hypothetical protein [Streptomyces sp. TX20-6-3]
MGEVPAANGVARPALAKLLGDAAAVAAGANVRLGVTITELDDDGAMAVEDAFVRPAVCGGGSGDAGRGLRAWSKGVVSGRG